MTKPNIILTKNNLDYQKKTLIEGCSSLIVIGWWVNIHNKYTKIYPHHEIHGQMITRIGNYNIMSIHWSFNFPQT